MNVKDVLQEHQIVAIVHYRLETGSLYNGGMSPQNPACLLQVTLDSKNLSPSKNLIRFGNTNGDEIIGWTKLEALEVVEILGKTDGATVFPLAA